MTGAWWLIAASTLSGPDAGNPARTRDAEPPAQGHLEVMCTPSSDILIDGKVVGHSRFPLVVHVAVDAGKHRFQCRCVDGRMTPAEEITVAPGETKVIERRLPRQ